MSTHPPTYIVDLATPHGDAAIDVPTFQGPDAAGRRAIVAAAHLGWGDLPDLTVINVREATDNDLADTTEGTS